MNVQRHTSLLDRSPAFGFSKKSGTFPTVRKENVPSESSSIPRRALSSSSSSQAQSLNSQPKSPDSSDAPNQRQAFQRSSLRSSISSVHSDGPMLRKAVSFGNTMRYEFPSNASKIPPPITNGLSTRPSNGGPTFMTSTPNYRSLPVPKNYHTAMARKEPLPPGVLSPTDGPSSETHAILRNRFGNQSLRSTQTSPIKTYNGTGVPYCNGRQRYSIGLPVAVPKAPGVEVPTSTAPVPAPRKVDQRSADSATSPNDDVFNKAPPGGLRPTDWSDSDGGASNRRNRPMKREERRHTVAGDNVVALPPVHSRSMDPIRVEGPKSGRSKSNKNPQEDPNKKDAILGHLQKKFPDYAGTIAGRKDQLVMHGSRDGKEWTKVVYSHLYTTQRSHSMYQPPSSIYDDDPGIMSEAETSATGFRRGGKQRSSLPVVRTPNKSLERPLGLVFLQYRNETKRALLPNEITSLDTVKALFVRSFPMQLSMEYLESPHLRIYIHDPSKDMFYELEDLRDIRDRSVLRIYEQDVNGGAPRSTWDQDTSYFSEPEFDSEYQHQHIHRAKASSKSLVPVAASAPSPVPPAASNYYGIAHASYVGTGRTATLPHPGSHRSYSPAALSERSKTQTLPHPGTDIGSRTLPLPGAMQPPPKPQRAYQQPVTSMAKSVRATPPPQGPPPPAPSPRTNQAGTSDRRIEHHRSYPMYLTPAASYEEPYYSTYGSRSGSVTPVIDEEARRDGYLLPAHGVQSLDQIRYRARVEYMERQLASLTGLVHKALTTSRPPPIQRDIEINLSRELLQVPTGRDAVAVYKGEVCEVKPSVSSSSSPSLSDDCKPESKTIPRPLSKEEKSVSFSDDPPTMSSPTHTKQHSPQHTAEKPTKPALKTSSTLPRAYSSDRESRQSNKPTPPPKPSSLVGGQYEGKMMPSGRDLQITPEMYNQLRLLKKRTKDLRVEVRNLRRITQAQALNIKETIRETFVKIKAMLAAVEADNDVVRAERNRVSREEEMYRQDISQLENNLSELEIEVEDLRSNVINRRCRVNMSEVESMALILSKASKTVADLKGRYPYLQENLKSVMAAEMEVIVKEEKFLKEEPDRLENVLRRCKKLTGTLVTLKRLASVQEQRLPPTSPGLEQRAASLPSSGSIGEQQYDGLSIGPDGQISKAASFSGEVSRQSSMSCDSSRCSSKGENALDALLDELQISAKPCDAKTEIYANTRSFKRLPSYPSSDSPLKGQVVSQGPSGSVSLTVTTAPINKLQVSDSGSRQSVSLSPTPSPVPPADGKLSPQPPELFARGGLRQTVIEGPNGTGPEKGSSLSPASTGGICGQIKKVPPPPPPRTSSKSPLVSPTSPMSPSGRHPVHMPRTSSLQVTNYNIPPNGSVADGIPRPTTNGATNGPRSRKSSLEAGSSRQSSLNNGDSPGGKEGPGVLRTVAISDENLRRDQLSSNSSSSESVNSQEGVQTKQPKNLDGGMSDAENKKTPPTPPTRNRQEILEQRHQELLRRQRQLQEQYARLQQMQRGQTLQRFSPPRSPADLKKTGSESNILSKAGLAMSTTSGSLTHLAPLGLATNSFAHNSLMTSSAPSSTSSTTTATAGGTTTNKIYETDIL